MKTKFVVSVVTDSFGSFQARCTHCNWRSQWFERSNVRGTKVEREAQAAQAAKEHGAMHAATEEQQ